MTRSFEGGAPPAFYTTAWPEGTSLYADGVAVIRTYDRNQSLIPTLLERRFTAPSMETILTFARRLGLFGGDHYEPTLRGGGAKRGSRALGADEVVTSFDRGGYGFIAVDNGRRSSTILEGSTPKDVVHRDLLGKLLAAFDPAKSTMATTRPDRPYPITRVRVRSETRVAENAHVLDWPGDVPLASIDDYLYADNCDVLTGDRLARVLKVISKVHTITYWRNAGVLFDISLRPLLPDDPNGCGGDSFTAPRHAAIAHANGPQDVIVQAWYRCACGHALDDSIEMPNVTIYGDGRVVYGGGTSGYGASAFIHSREARFSESQIQHVLAAAEVAGILALPDGSTSKPPRTVGLFVTAAGKRHVWTQSAGDRSVTPPRMFFSRVQSVRSFVDPADLRPIREYIPGAYRALAQPFALRGLLDTAHLRWPLPTPLGAMPLDRNGQHCVVLQGQALARALPVLRRAVYQTRWDSGSGVFHVLLRPLLPDEAGC